MGFLPTINHIWLSTGYSLFLWNYVDKTDVFRYECSDKIENVEVIKLLTHHELVVSTTNKLYLHGLSFEGYKGKLNIITTTSTKSDSVIMSNFVSTNTRRAFMRGSDGHVYELIVYTDNDGLTSSCKTYCHTSSYILRYLSTSIFKSVPEGKK
jgi:hypothetical protein